VKYHKRTTVFYTTTNLKPSQVLPKRCVKDKGIVNQIERHNEIPVEMFKLEVLSHDVF